jgi:hypothetical protein
MSFEQQPQGSGNGPCAATDAQDKFYEEERRIMRTQAGKALKLAVPAVAALARRKVMLAVWVVLCALTPAFPQGDDKATIITFDPPGSTFTIAGSGSTHYPAPW